MFCFYLFVILFNLHVVFWKKTFKRVFLQCWLQLRQKRTNTIPTTVDCSVDCCYLEENVSKRWIFIVTSRYILSWCVCSLACFYKHGMKSRDTMSTKDEHDGVKRPRFEVNTRRFDI